MLDPVMSAWDAGALLPVLREAGGSLTDLHGNTSIYGGSAFSTNGTLFDQVIEIMEDANR